jgi:hypothetical protein
MDPTRNNIKKKEPFRQGLFKFVGSNEGTSSGPDALVVESLSSQAGCSVAAVFRRTR